jgi:hypothetical protein
MFKYEIKSLLKFQKRSLKQKIYIGLKKKEANRKSGSTWKQRLMSLSLSTNWRMKLVADFTNVFAKVGT